MSQLSPDWLQGVHPTWFETLAEMQAVLDAYLDGMAARHVAEAAPQ